MTASAASSARPLRERNAWRAPVLLVRAWRYARVRATVPCRSGCSCVAFGCVVGWCGIAPSGGALPFRSSGHWWPFPAEGQGCCSYSQALCSGSLGCPRESTLSAPRVSVLYAMWDPHISCTGSVPVPRLYGVSASYCVNNDAGLTHWPLRGPLTRNLGGSWFGGCGWSRGKFRREGPAHMALLRPHMGPERVTLARPHRLHRASHAVRTLRTHGHTIAIVSAHRFAYPGAQTCKSRRCTNIVYQPVCIGAPVRHRAHPYRMWNTVLTLSGSRRPWPYRIGHTPRV